MHFPKLLAVGQQAPDFDLKLTPDQRLTLSSLFGRPVILAFYAADWSPVCGDQLAIYSALHDEWRKHRAQVLGLSVDGPWCHIAYSKERHLQFPLLSDFEPKGQVARAYGAYLEDEGVAARALFVLSHDHKVAWNYLSPLGINPGADGLLEALEALHAHPRQESAHV